MSKQDILKIIKDNFTLWIEPNYRVTLQFQQNTSLTKSDYDELIGYFGKPRDPSPKKKIVKRENLKIKPVTEFPILETLSNVNTRNSGYVKADVTKDGEVIFSSTNNAKEACTVKEISQLLK